MTKIVCILGMMLALVSPAFSSEPSDPSGSTAKCLAFWTQPSRLIAGSMMAASIVFSTPALAANSQSEMSLNKYIHNVTDTSQFRLLEMDLDILGAERVTKIQTPENSEVYVINMRSDVKVVFEPLSSRVVCLGCSGPNTRTEFFDPNGRHKESFGPYSLNAVIGQYLIFDRLYSPAYANNVEYIVIDTRTAKLTSIWPYSDDERPKPEHDLSLNIVNGRLKMTFSSEDRPAEIKLLD